MTIDKILERGKAIAKEQKATKGEIIQQTALNTYRVHSIDHYNTVTYDHDDGYSCTCRYYMFKGNPCKHIAAIKTCIEEGIFIPKTEEICSES